MHDVETIFNHFVFVAIAPIEAECKVDEDCSPGLACINAECQNPCEVNRPCHFTQTCKVENSSPIRTVICVCPDDSFIGPNGERKPKGECWYLPKKGKIIIFII